VIITRVVGRTTLGELSTFELLLYVTMGDLVQSAVTQQDFSVTGGVLAISVFALLTVGFSYANCRWPRVRPVVHGVPVVVVRAGEPLLDTMRAERMSLDDLATAARGEGIERFADIELAVLEVNGRVSFFSSASTDSSGSPEGPAAGA